MKRLGLALVVLSVIFWPHHATVEAAKGLPCSYFVFQDDAQFALETYSYSASLDPDGDSIACNELPPRPPELLGAMTVTMDHVDDRFVLIGVTPDQNAQVTLAGIDFSQPMGCGMDSLGAVQSMFPSGTKIFVMPDPAIPVQEPNEGQLRVTGWVYGIEPDGATPFLVNQKLVEAGLGKSVTAGLSSPLTTSMVAAEGIAHQSHSGIWGDCEAPDLAPGPTPTPFGQILNWTGNGDQVSNLFAITTEGTYRLTVNGSASLLFVDLYDQYGNWLPGFSISASGGGSFASAGYLPAGQYYVQVQANGQWNVALNPMV